ncbi:MAG TPA: peptidoglycan bridge formation glycyltransferase FemA/FemB family protein [Anaerolineae bacterium]|nr:peptidoglycan bridge formation glycyltransferase FemA/FemB family protein [Anaerolineae bacterium]
MQEKLIQNVSEWDSALADIPYAHVLQSWTWGEIKARHGWTPTRVLFCENGAPRAAVQILRRPLPRTPSGVLYVPKGPALNFDDVKLFEHVLSRLENLARQQRGIFIKIDPDIRVNQPAASILSQRGWRVSDEQIQFHNTVTLDLTRSEKELLAAMKSKWRYNIGLAERKGVAIESGDEDSFETFYQMYAETSARDGFLIRSFAYYKDVWQTMLRANQAKLLLARVGEETVAGLILFFFDKRAWYFYGASRNTHRDVMPNHLLQWQAIRWAKARGCTEYDFWGAPDMLDEHAPMYGVYKFKMGFGGEFVERIPAHDFVVNRALYWGYAVARPRYLARLRRRRAAIVD